MASKDILTLSAISDVMKLELFRAQYELARNFYDDLEFCPLPYIDEAVEHRDRIKRRLLPSQQTDVCSSSRRNSDSSSSLYQKRRSSKQLANNAGSYRIHSQHASHSSMCMPSFVQPSKSMSASTTSVVSKAIPIIDPTSRAPVTVSQSVSSNHNSRSQASKRVSQPVSNQYWASFQNEDSQFSSSSNSSNSSDSPRSQHSTFNNSVPYVFSNDNPTCSSNQDILNVARTQSTVFMENNNNQYCHSANYQSNYQPTMPSSKMCQNLHSLPQEITPNVHYNSAGEHHQQQYYELYQQAISLHPTYLAPNAIPIVNPLTRQALRDY